MNYASIQRQLHAVEDKIEVFEEALSCAKERQEIIIIEQHLNLLLNKRKKLMEYFNDEKSKPETA